MRRSELITKLRSEQAKLKKLLLGGDPANKPRHEAVTTTYNDALVLACGNATTPETTSVANSNFVEMRCETTATTASSDTRLAYLRMYFAGATTGGGETLRVFSTVEAACGTVRGAHISLNWGASGSVSGLGTAITATLHCPNTGVMTGNVAALEAQAYMDSGDDDDVTVPTEHGLIRCTISGDAGTVASFKNILHVDVAAACVGNKAAALAVCNADVTGDGGAAAAGLQVRVEGTQYWIPLYAIS